MANNNKKKFIIDLEIDSKTAEQQIKSSVKNFNDAVAKFGKGFGGTKYFQEIIGYINAIDEQADAFKKKHGDDLFQKVFGDLDSNLTSELEKAFGLTKEQVTILDQVRSKLSLLKRSDTTTKDDLKPLEQEIKALYKAAGILDKLDLGGKGNFKVANKIEFIEKAIDGLVLTFQDADKKLGKTEIFDNIGDGLDDNFANLKQTAKKYVNEFYDAILDGADDSKLDTIKNKLKDALSLDDVDFAKFSDIFKGLEVGSIEEDEAIEKIEAATQRIYQAKQKLQTGTDVNQTSVSTNDPIVDNIQEQVDEQVKAIEYGKQKLVEAWKDYYNAAMEAEKSGVKIEDGDTTFDMDDAVVSIEKMLNKWNVDGKAKFELMSLSDYIIDKDIDIDGIENEINKIFTDLDIKPDIPLDEVIKDTEKSLENSADVAQQSSKDMSAGFENVEESVQSVTHTFQDLVNYISKSGSSPKAFFDALKSGTQDIDDELTQILQSLKLMDDYGNLDFNTIQSGFKNTGGIISNDYALISRPEKSLKYALELQPKMLDAKAMGANIGAIVDIYKDEENKLIYELQNTVKGKGILDFEKGIVNTEFLEATDEQIRKLIDDLLILQKTGLYVDWGGDNILYDKENGFSFIDLASKSTSFTASEENSVQENIGKFFEQAFDFNPSLKDNPFVKHVNDLMDAVIVDNTAQQNLQNITQDMADGSNTAATSLQKEETAHEQNTDAINAENDALQTQIDLKKKAQSMTWESFALDDSLTDAKNALGLQSLSQAEKFWKSANYEKEIDFHEISPEEAKEIIKKGIDHETNRGWYTSYEYSDKDKIENAILADNELRNAAMNQLWNIYKDNVDKTIAFNDFINKEFTVYRGEKPYPTIYGDEQLMSFSFEHNTGKDFGYHVENTKIIPKNTVGSANIGDYQSETEIFVPSDKLPTGPDSYYINNPDQSFEDYYDSLTPSMKKAVDHRLIQLEKDRVANLIGSEMANAVDELTDYAPFMDNFINKVAPKTLAADNENAFVKSHIYQNASQMYDNMSDIQKKMVAYYATLSPTADFYKQYKQSSNDIGGTGLLNAVVSDKLGVQKHVEELTDESQFGIYDSNVQTVEAEVVAHEKNAQAIHKEAQAQHDLHKSKSMYDDVTDKIQNVIGNDLNKTLQFGNLKSALKDINFTQNTKDSDEVIDNGEYISKITGKTKNVKDVISEINKLENKYGENLDYVKDYLQQVYKNLDIDTGQIKSAVTSADFATDLESAALQLLNYMGGGDQTSQKAKSLEDIYQSLFGIDNSIDYHLDEIQNGKYVDSHTGEVLNASGVLNAIKDVEAQYGINLDQVTDYIQQVYKKFNVDTDKLKSLGANEVGAKLWDSIDYIEDYSKADALAGIYNQIGLVKNTAQSNQLAINDGEYFDPDTGALLDVSDLLDSIKSVENQFGEDLNYVKDYLNQVYKNYFNQMSQGLIPTDIIDLDDDDILLEYGEDDYSSYDTDHLMAPDDQPSTYDIEYNSNNEIQQLDKLKSKVEEVRMAVDEKTQAFRDEESTVDGVVTSEISAIQKLLDALQEVINKINLIDDAFKQINNTDVAQIETDIEDHSSISSDKIPQGSDNKYALDSTLSETNSLLGQILSAINSGEGMSKLASSLEGAVTQLKDVANGIIKHQQSQKSDYTDSTAKIQNNYKQLSDIAMNSVSQVDGFTDEVQINQMKALADGVVSVEGAVKNADGVWEGFIVHINESNQAIINSIGKQSAYAKSLNETTTAAKVLENAMDDVESTPSELSLPEIVKGIAELKGLSKSITKEFDSLGFLSVDKNLSAEQEEIKNLYQSTIAIIGKYQESVANGNKIELDSLDNVVTALRQKIALYKENQGILNSNKGGQKFGATAVLNETARYNQLQSYKNDQNAGFAGSAKFIAELTQYEAAYDNLIAKRKELATLDNITDAQEAEFKQLQKECTAAAKSVEKLVQESLKLKNSGTGKQIRLGEDFVDTLDGRKQALTDFVDGIHGVDAEFEKFSDNYTKLIYTVKNGDGTFTRMTASLDDARTAIVETAGDTQKATSAFGRFFSDLKGKFRSIGQYFISSMGIEEIWQQFRNGIQYVRDIDLALTELKKVTNETDATYSEFLQTMSEVGSAIGATTVDLTNSAADWARLGWIFKSAPLCSNT